MGELAQYKVSVPVTYYGTTTKGIFRKRNIPYEITLITGLPMVYNARSPWGAQRKAIADAEKTAMSIMEQAAERKARGDYIRLSGNLPDGEFIWSKKFISIDRFTIGTPKVTKIKDWKDATTKELAHSNLSIREFQEVFDKIKQEQRNKNK